MSMTYGISAGCSRARSGVPKPSKASAEKHVVPMSLDRHPAHVEHLPTDRPCAVVCRAGCPGVSPPRAIASDSLPDGFRDTLHSDDVAVGSVCRLEVGRRRQQSCRLATRLGTIV